MKNTFVVLGALLFLNVTACKKDEADGSPNTMTVAGTRYSITKTTTSLNGISLVHNETPTTGTMITIYFGTNFNVPEPGTYKIVDRAVNGNEATLSVGRVTDNTTTVYGSQSGGSTAVTLTSEGGKYRVILPPTLVKDVSGTRTITVSADALEQ